MLINIHHVPTTTQANRLELSEHAQLRMAQRNLSVEDLEYVLQNGQSGYVSGARYYYLGKRDIPEPDQHDSRTSQIEGATFLVSDNTVITAYRNRECPPKKAQKAKRRRYS